MQCVTKGTCKTAKKQGGGKREMLFRRPYQTTCDPLKEEGQHYEKFCIFLTNTDRSCSRCTSVWFCVTSPLTHTTSYVRVWSAAIEA